MLVQPIKTRLLQPPSDKLFPVITEALDVLPERSILAITAKVVSIDQGRCVPFESTNKDELIANEADLFISRDKTPGRYVMHTITDGILMPSAGIDESNANGYYILWPRNLPTWLALYHTSLQKKFGTKEFGIVVVDSRSQPLRRGVVGIALDSIGFKRLHDYRGTKDLFENDIVSSQGNVPDALAAAATMTMGEGSEQTPIALLSDMPFIEFGIFDESESNHATYKVPLTDDIYRPFFDIDWKKGKKGATKK